MPIDPLTLLLLIVFVVLPLINRLTRRQQPGQRPPGSPEPDPEPPPQATTRPAQPASAEEELVRRIEEAQRRVQQVLGGEPAPRPRPEPPKPRPAPPVRRQVTGSLETLEPASRISLESPGAPRRQAVSLESLEPLTRPGVREAKPLALRRRGKQPTSSPLGFDRSSLIGGIIWREILDKPPSKRRSRR
ncbi:MAG: hypothetical protein KGZ60_02255 [Truepera sp.]|nr:hypothetical protein [Truepera sp.]